MKSLFLALVAGFVTLTAYSQSSTETQEWQIRRQMLEGRNRNLLTIRTEPANEIRSGRFSYNGIFVQMSKTGNPLQLINPAAPPEYGSGWDNVVTNPLGEPPASSSRQGLEIVFDQFLSRRRKLQASKRPSSREAPTFKHQLASDRILLAFGIWILEFGASLELGAWNLELLER